jgi:hypothetical protein
MSKRKRRRRPSRHYRRIKTKKGKKLILINPNIKKPKKKKTKRPSRKTKVRGRISKTDRKVFNNLSNPKYFKREYGGGLDFNEKGKLENINVVPGKMFDVYLPPDFEVQYHTHPSKDILPPSPDDVMALLGNEEQQAEIVFRDGNSFQIVKTPSTKALSKLPATRVKFILDKAFDSTSDVNFEKDWKNKLEELGFVVYINNNPDKALNVRIKPVE